MMKWASPVCRFVSLAFLLGVTAFSLAGATAQEATTDSRKSEAVVFDRDIETMIFNLNAKIVELDLLIADRGVQLDKLYAQREDSENGSGRVLLDNMIDRVTLKLDQMETLSETLKDQAETLRHLLYGPSVDLAQPSESDTDGYP